MTFQKVAMRPAPSERDASRIAGLMLRNALLIGSTMNGVKTWTSAIATRPCVNSSRIGRSMMPSDRSARLSGPRR